MQWSKIKIASAIYRFYIDIEVFLHLPYRIEINIAFAYAR